MRFRTAWGKAASPNESHSLINHSADVSAVFLSLLDQPVWRSRVTAAAGRELLPEELECLGALVFLHDIGKLAPGFQAKSWPTGHGLTLIGHLEAGWRWTSLSRRDALAGALFYLKSWPGVAEWFAALFAHHGRPVGRPAAGVAAAAFPVRSDYDWQDQETKLGQCFLTWFPAVRASAPPSPSPRLVHLFCGLLTLSDWVASDRRAFPFEPETSDCYWQTAKQRARDRVAEIGLAACPELRGPATWALISDHPRPPAGARGDWEAVTG
jgi:CRISPR-associated endonuclease/helicase Cas3